MLLKRIALAALVLAGHACAACAAEAPIRVILVGDSTMATKSATGGAPTGKMIFSGGTIGYLDTSDPNAPYFAVSAFVQ